MIFMTEALAIKGMILRPALYTGVLPRLTPREAAQRVLDDIAKDDSKLRRGIEVCLSEPDGDPDGKEILRAVYGTHGYGPRAFDLSLLKTVLSPVGIGLKERTDEDFPAELVFLDNIVGLMQETHGSALGYFLFHIGDRPLVQLPHQ